MSWITPFLLLHQLKHYQGMLSLFSLLCSPPPCSLSPASYNTARNFPAPLTFFLQKAGGRVPWNAKTWI